MSRLMAYKDHDKSGKIIERELLIIKMHFGVEMPNKETWTLHQIAKLFNISCERVRQIETWALTKLSKIQTCRNFNTLVATRCWRNQMEMTQKPKPLIKTKKIYKKI